MTFRPNDRVHLSSYVPGQLPSLFSPPERFLAGTVIASRRGRTMVKWDDPQFQTRFIDDHLLRKGEPPNGK